MIFEIVHEKCIDQKNIDSDDFLRKDAKHIVTDKYHNHLVTMKRDACQDECKTVANIELYEGEEKYIEEKILVNNPKLTCTGITKLITNATVGRTAFVAFFGSGNHMMRCAIQYKWLYFFFFENKVCKTINCQLLVGVKCNLCLVCIGCVKFPKSFQIFTATILYDGTYHGNF